MLYHTFFKYFDWMLKIFNPSKCLKKVCIVKFLLQNLYRTNPRSVLGFYQNFLIILVPNFTKECSDVARAWSTTLTLQATTPSCLARALQTSPSATTAFASLSEPSTSSRRLKVPNFDLSLLVVPMHTSPAQYSTYICLYPPYTNPLAVDIVPLNVDSM